LHKYALEIGWPVPLLKKVMSSRDISEAMAYDRIEPFGEYRRDFRSGIIASTIANIHAAKGKSYKPSDFMPNFGERKQDSKKVLIEKIKGVFGVGNTSKSSN
jgi:hypothetical protein